MLFNFQLFLLLLNSGNLSNAAKVHETTTGWQTVSTSLEPTCDLERLQIGDESLTQRLQNLGAPVIIEGAIDHWSAMLRWKDKANLQQRYGHLPLRTYSLLNSSIDTAQDGTNVNTATNSLLRHLLTAMEGGKKAPFLFERANLAEGSTVAKMAEDLGGGMGRPFSHDQLIPQLKPLGYENLILSIGGPDGGK